MEVAYLPEGLRDEGPRIACPRSSPRVVVPGRLVTDRPGRDVMVATASVAVLQWVIDRSRDLRNAQTLEAIRQLSGLGTERTRTALSAAVAAGYLTRHRMDGDAYTYEVVAPIEGEYVLWIDSYDFARPDLTAQQRAAYLVLLGYMQSGGETRRLCNRKLAKFLDVSPRMAGRHAGSLEKGPMPLLERIDTTTEGRRWRLLHHRVGARAGKARLREILQLNQCRNPLVAGRMLRDRPTPDFAPLSTATTGGGYKGFKSSRNTEYGRSPSAPQRHRRQDSKHQRLRMLPRQRSDVQDQLDRLWTLLDADTEANRTPLGPIEVLANDLLRRVKLDVAVDAMIYVRLEVSRGTIHSPLAAARSIARCYSNPAGCHRRHHGPCGAQRRNSHRVRVREEFIQRDKAVRSEEASAAAAELAALAPDLLGKLLFGTTESGAASWYEWVAAFRPEDGMHSTEAFLEVVPRQWRMSDRAYEWAVNEAKRAVHRVLRTI